MLAPTTAPVAEAPSISTPTVIQHIKGIVTRALGHPLWQKTFHDHIVRNERAYRMVWEYIDTTPFRWTEDCFCQP